MRTRKLLAIAAVILAAIAAGGVAAWLSSGATARNEITTGKVDIHLVEESWDPELAKGVLPNAALPRDPRVRNDGSTDAYVFITVEVPALPEGTAMHSGAEVLRAGQDTPLFSTESEGGGAFDGAHWAAVSHSVRGGRLTQVYAYAHNNQMTPLKRGELTPALFDRVRMANVANTNDLAGTDASIAVTAYGIQTRELGKAGDAAAPLEVWNIVSTYQESKNQS